MEVQTPGHSREQQACEGLIVAYIAESLNCELSKRRIALPEGGFIEVDGCNSERTILCEAWAHQGLPRPAQKAKVITELIDGLCRWLTNCDDDTVGDESVYGGAPWLHFETALGPVVINADTTHQAVERMAAASRVGARW